MSILTTKNSLCQGMNQGFEGVIGPANQAKGGFDAIWNQVESGLYVLKNTVGFNDPGTLGAAVDGLKDQAKAFYPGDQLEDMNTIKNLIDNCDYLNGLQPVAALIGAITGLFDEISNLIDGIALTLPEFGIGNLIGRLLDALKSLFPGGGSLKDLLAQGDQLINCLDALCGARFASQASLYSAQLTTLYDDMHLYDSGPQQGLPKLDELYDSVGMDPVEKSAMDVVNAGIEGTKEDALSAVDSSIAAVKSFTSVGGLFG